MNPIEDNDLGYKISHWQKCDVNGLVGYFHRFDVANHQYERLLNLELGESKTTALFFERNVSSFEISLAAEAEVASHDNFTFKPVIRVNYETGEPKEYPFDFGKPGLKVSTVIPAELSNWLTKNWRELDASLVDDAFTAFLPLPPPADQSVKVKQRIIKYCFKPTPPGKLPEDNPNGKFLDFIRKHRNELKNFIFHLGVDMNKFAHKDFFGFSPVFEITLNKPAPDERLQRLIDVHESGLRSVFTGDDKDDPILYEYSSPCPSSC